MGDKLGGRSSEQGLAFRGLSKVAADAEERQQSSHAELPEMMASLLKNDREGGGQQKSGGERKLSAVGTAGRDAVSPSLDRFDDGTGSQEERGDAAEADPTGVILAVEGKIGAMPFQVSPQSLRGIFFRIGSFLGQPKMAVPTLKGRDNFDSLSKQVRVYIKLHGFESILDNDSYIEVGAEGSDRASLMAQGVTASMYEKQLMARVFLSQALQTTVDQATFYRSKSPKE